MAANPTTSSTGTASVAALPGPEERDAAAHPQTSVSGPSKGRAAGRRGSDLLPNCPRYRIGMAQDLVAAGAGVAAVQLAGRWVSPQMPSYAPAELAGDGAVPAFSGKD